RRVHVRGQKVVETEIGFLLMSMNLTKLAKKLAQDSRNRKKNTDSLAEFYQNQLESICVFYLLASFCPASSKAAGITEVRQGEFKQSSEVFEVGNKETEFLLMSK
ncbi:TPA: hypothetical protein ACGO14_002112, partial [Streptococcus suis]